MAEGEPELELAAKVAEALEKEGLLEGLKKEDFEKQFASGKMASYAWKRMYERMTDEAESGEEGQR